MLLLSFLRHLSCEIGIPHSHSFFKFHSNSSEFYSSLLSVSFTSIKCLFYSAMTEPMNVQPFSYYKIPLELQLVKKFLASGKIE
jgi:hypothetical protein